MPEGGDSFGFFMLGVIGANTGFFACLGASRGRGNFPFSPLMTEHGYKSHVTTDTLVAEIV